VEKTKEKSGENKDHRENAIKMINQLKNFKLLKVIGSTKIEFSVQVEPIV